MDQGARRRRIRLGLALACAAVLFAALFGGCVVDFWLQLAATALTLAALAFLFEPAEMRRLIRITPARLATALLLGVLAAAALYGVFAAGGWVATRIMPQAEGEIRAVYALRGHASGWVLVALLLGVIGPGEELFWRGYVQRRLSAELGGVGTALAVLAYAAVHLASGNLTLTLAALTCGAFWALLYQRYASIWLNIVSHGCWAVAIFVLFPVA